MLLLHRLTWLRIAAAWGLFTLFMLVLVYAQALIGAAPWHGRTLLLAPLIYGLTGTLLTPLVFVLAQRFDLTAGRAHWLPYLLVHAAASVALTIAYRAVFLSALFLVGNAQAPVSWAAIFSGVNFWVPIYWMLLFVVYALDYYARWQRRNVEASRLEMQLAQSQLQVLKQQLNPHFLFNTLNGIATLIGDEPRAAQRMTAKLGEFLRLVLDHTDAHQVPLAQELHFIELYLEMEQVRFAGRLAVSVEVTPAAQLAVVPHLLLQPLVENAVRHGLSAPGVGSVHIRADRRGDQLVLEVRDSGPGPYPTTPHGVGLANTEQRLRLLYGTRYALALEAAPAQGAVVRLELPFTTLISPQP
ncbi:sensor histidine kinase [Hymenobacter properus]|uniref:Histidine kinase n=1 Tax=Hymenobacter properus TaxID=2791026 RepID=A0A931BM26_9BACT|nr:histidine kinase [Hymenobacter properus]MBF9141940.1 histidine kinase [Hymenobacter properus]MBR7720747.1 histidine kinase [Microvirga sp. SRT04]